MNNNNHLDILKKNKMGIFLDRALFIEGVYHWRSVSQNIESNWQANSIGSS